ncbi:hypothetical protein [Nocardioides coralli]|uniref:hypothetical protein n=1 Tax=Nocardioides coralli TaxID=2872154 RepID=UPI001CA3EA94|nr:hypothetical protein [Nocardioides coralli]QZY29548.1 hypothetical protein K6T13_02300 [Nocardioides coralli]
MLPDTPSRRLAAELSLLASPVLALLFVALSPPFPDDPVDRLAGFADGWAPTVSATAFTVMQLPMLVAFLAIGRLLLPGARRLSAWGTALAVVGCFGHVVFGGLSMAYLVMAHDEANRATYAGLMADVESSPVMVFAVAGLLGTVLGELLLSIGLFRTRTGPRWVGPAVWAFLVLEFGLSAVSPLASYLAVLLLGAAFWALALEIRARSHVDGGRQPVGEHLGVGGQRA